jgi:ADP-heptose:LPS heptosyltransferase
MVQKRHFDLVINLQTGLRSEALTELSHAPIRLGYARKGMRKSCYTKILTPEWSGEYRGDDMAAVISEYGEWTPIDYCFFEEHGETMIKREAVVNLASLMRKGS